MNFEVVSFVSNILVSYFLAICCLVFKEAVIEEKYGDLHRERGRVLFKMFWIAPDMFALALAFAFTMNGIDRISTDWQWLSRIIFVISLCFLVLSPFLFKAMSAQSYFETETEALADGTLIYPVLIKKTLLKISVIVNIILPLFISVSSLVILFVLTRLK